MALKLECTNFYDEKGKQPKFPPEGLKEHSQNVDRESIKRAIEKGEEILVISAHNTEKALANKGAQKKSERTDDMVH